MESSNTLNTGALLSSDLNQTVVQVLIYAVVLLVALLAIYLIAVVLSLIFRLLFKQVRFIVMFVLSLAAFAVFGFFMFVKPLGGDQGDPSNSNVFEQVVAKYKGLYPNDLPLVAWRITDITDAEASKATGETMNPESEDTNKTISKGGRIYKVSYLPFGELIVKADPMNGDFDITSSADGKNLSENIKGIMDGFLTSIKLGAEKTFKGIQTGLLDSVDFVKSKTDGGLIKKVDAPILPNS